MLPLNHQRATCSSVQRCSIPLGHFKRLALSKLPSSKERLDFCANILENWTIIVTETVIPRCLKQMFLNLLGFKSRLKKLTRIFKRSIKKIKVLPSYISNAFFAVQIHQLNFIKGPGGLGVNITKLCFVYFFPFIAAKVESL